MERDFLEPQIYLGKIRFWGEKPALARESSLAYTEKMIRFTGAITIDEREIHRQFIRVSGPGAVFWGVLGSNL